MAKLHKYGELGGVKEGPGFALGFVWRRSLAAFCAAGWRAYLPGSGRTLLCLWDIAFGIQVGSGFQFHVAEKLQEKKDKKICFWERKKKYINKNELSLCSSEGFGLHLASTPSLVQMPC